MVNCVRTELFEQLEVPLQLVDLSVEPIGVNVESGVINRVGHFQLYDYFESGGQLLHQINRDGELELFCLLDEGLEVDTIRGSKWGVEIEQSEELQFVFNFLVYDMEDDPLKLPLIFELEDNRQRYHVAAFVEQQAVPFHFISFNEEGQLNVEYTNVIRWPDGMRNSIRDAVLRSVYIEE